MITKTFNQSLQILEVKYQGNIYFDELIEFGNQIYLDYTLPRLLRILTDVSCAEYKFAMDKINELMKDLELHISNFELIKAAFIYETPTETAYSMLLGMGFVSKKYQHAIFATREAAIVWLLDNQI